MRMRLTLRMLMLGLLLAGCGSATPSPRYERVSVPSTPFTPHKLAVDEVICVEQGKTLACVVTPRNTQDCWCDPR